MLTVKAFEANQFPTMLVKGVTPVDALAMSHREGIAADITCQNSCQREAPCWRLGHQQPTRMGIDWFMWLPLKGLRHLW
ncbi:MAG: hypothetical protein EBS66_18155 [Betaproteobacteria bacterium]|nr:hypothetical protein [Betaproteobacteria bacterium]